MPQAWVAPRLRILPYSRLRLFLMLRAIGLPPLDAHPFDRGAPVGEPQYSEGTDLEGVGPSRGEIVDGNCGSRSGEHYRCPIDSDSGSGNRRVAKFVDSGLGDRFDRHQKLTAIALIDRNDEGCRQRLRWSSLARGSGRET